ncbi:MAG: UV DNA damage repair endonuclease UvsE [Candidatus Thermoplasmatota archaeon]|nr:UV DNA damage repair endonuclease UvsE [Candidatus Thermoplasmatota archaeon]
MKIGYPCINRSLSCKGDRTFRLRSYSEERLQQTIRNNLDCLFQILRFNLDHGLLFFRISSDLVPFASHPVCTFPWQTVFQKRFEEIGQFIMKNDIRISMHPDQFIVLNTPREDVYQRSVAELAYHAEVLDLMGLDTTAKIQLHVGGVYGEKAKSIKRFIARYKSLDASLKRRLVIENDEKSYSICDCLQIHEKIKIPVLFDYFHHTLLNDHESLSDVLESCKKAWKPKDGIPMVDYSSQKPHMRKGSHAEHLNNPDFSRFLLRSKPYDFDLMLEIKDKEKSAIKAVKVLESDIRFLSPTR